MQQQEQKQTKKYKIFSQIPDIFVIRKIFLYLQPYQILHTISLINKSANKLAYDCAIWQKLFYGHKSYQPSYDYQDYLESFLKAWRDRDKLRKLDFHYCYRGVELDDSLISELKHFTNLEDLRFGEHKLSPSNLKVFQQELSFPKLHHITIPLQKDKSQAYEFLDMVMKVAPNLKSLTFQDIQYEKESLTQQCASKIAQIGIQQLRMMVHEQSKVDTMKAIVSEVYPNLKKIYIKRLLPENDSHQKILNSLFVPNQNLKEVKLRCDGKVVDYNIGWEVTSLRTLQINRLTSSYQTLCKFIVNNFELQKLIMKTSWQQENAFDPRPFTLSHMNNLKILKIEGEFTQVNFSDLPNLTTLKVRYNFSHFKLVARDYETLNLVKLVAQGVKADLTMNVTQLILNFDAVRQASFILSKVSFEGTFTNLNFLKTSQMNLIERMIDSPNLYHLQYKTYSQLDECCEQFMPKLKKIPNLSHLSLDFVYINEKSIGDVSLDHPNIHTYKLRSCNTADKAIKISENCKKLHTFILLQTLQKKIKIDAPNIQKIKIDGLRIYEKQDLVISSMSGYTLHMYNGVIHLQNCPGVGKLIIESNWSSQNEKMTIEKKQNYYPYLDTIIGRRLSQYSNQFFFKLNTSAPNLKEIYLMFNESVRLEDKISDSILHISHPNVKYCTFLRGQEFFTGIKINKTCVNMKLLKFRDFVIQTLENEPGVREWSEKNFLNDEDYFGK